MGKGFVRERTVVLPTEKPVFEIGLSERETKLLLAGLQALTASASVTSSVTDANVAMTVFRPAMALTGRLRYALEKGNMKEGDDNENRL